MDGLTLVRDFSVQSEFENGEFKLFHWMSNDLCDEQVDNHFKNWCDYEYKSYLKIELDIPAISHDLLSYHGISEGGECVQGEAHSSFDEIDALYKELKEAIRVLESVKMIWK